MRINFFVALIMSAIFTAELVAAVPSVEDLRALGEVVDSCMFLGGRLKTMSREERAACLSGHPEVSALLCKELMRDDGEAYWRSATLQELLKHPALMEAIGKVTIHGGYPDRDCFRIFASGAAGFHTLEELWLFRCDLADKDFLAALLR